MAQPKSPFDDPWVNPFTPSEAPVTTYPEPINAYPDIAVVSSNRMKRESAPKLQITSNTAMTSSQSEVLRRQRELDQRDAELIAREQALNEQAAVFKREKNWPPLPSFCPCGPCFFQDIGVDIPEQFQKIVRLAYYTFLIDTVALMLNIIGLIVLWAAVGSYGVTFAYAILVVVLCVPLSYLFWFRPIYRAFKNDSSFNFMLFFFVMFVRIIISVCWAVGVPGTPACGLLVTISAFNTGNIGLGIFILLITLLLTAVALLEIYLLISIHRIYRGTGASFNKAKAEFAVKGLMA